MRASRGRRKRRRRICSGFLSCRRVEEFLNVLRRTNTFGDAQNVGGQVMPESGRDRGWESKKKMLDEYIEWRHWRMKDEG